MSNPPGGPVLRPRFETSPEPPPSSEPPKQTPKTTLSYFNKWWNIFLVILMLIFVVLAGVVTICVIVIVANGMSQQRYAIEGVGTTNTTKTMRGIVVLDSSANTIAWNVQYTNIGDTPVAIYINGPIVFGTTTGPLDVVLCGSPSSYICPVPTPGLLQGEINNYGGVPLGTYIAAIRNLPSWYYLSVYFAGGIELRAPLGISAGT
jgi:hypothetical protein